MRVNATSPAVCGRDAPGGPLRDSKTALGVVSSSGRCVKSTGFVFMRRDAPPLVAARGDASGDAVPERANVCAEPRIILVERGDGEPFADAEVKGRRGSDGVAGGAIGSAGSAEAAPPEETGGELDGGRGSYCSMLGGLRTFGMSGSVGAIS